MKITLGRYDIQFEGAFLSPVASFASGGTDVLGAVITALSGRYPVAADQVKFVPSTTLSEVRMQIGLFNGNGNIRIYPDRIETQFNNATGPEDLAIIEDCIALTLDGLRSVNPSLEFNHERLTVHTRISLENGTTSEALSRFCRAELKDRMAGIDKTVIFRQGLKFDFESSADQWRLSLEMSPAWGHDESVLFLYANCTFQRASNCSTIQQKSSVVRQYIQAALQALDMTPL